MAPPSGTLPGRVRAFVDSPEFGKLLRYVAVSVISTAVSLTALYLFFHIFKVGSAAFSNVLATIVATVPSYYLNRTWAWGKTGKSHLMREVVPFWVIAFVSLVLSTLAVAFADHEAKLHSPNHRTLIVLLANFVTYGVLWVGKFVLFNAVLFKHRETDQSEGSLALVSDG